jgi:two-component system, sensor histidine kinase and response regulator
MPVLKKLLTMTTILVIDDQEMLREELLQILRLERFQVLAAENGQEGLELARVHQPDLILCDVVMPVMDGHGVLQALRDDPTTARIPFIFLTGKTDKFELRKGMKLGADDYLTKPFSRTELLEAIAAQFRKQEAIEQSLQHKLDSLRSSITLSLPHELHTPLTAIIGMADLLMDDDNTFTKLEVQEMLYAIHESAERLYKLTQNFLLYAELELMLADAQRVAGLRQEAICAQAATAIATIATKQAKQCNRQADLQLTLQDGVVPVPEHRLQKIATEIIDNAFKFSEAGTPVTIAIYVENNHFVLSVSDRGRGMTTQQIDSVGAYMQFERRLYEQQGSGLGLIIAKRLTELYGGQLSIESAPNQTTVKVMLPI